MNTSKLEGLSNTEVSARRKNLVLMNYLIKINEIF